MSTKFKFWKLKRCIRHFIPGANVANIESLCIVPAHQLCVRFVYLGHVHATSTTWCPVIPHILYICCAYSYMRTSCAPWQCETIVQLWPAPNYFITKYSFFYSALRGWHPRIITEYNCLCPGLIFFTPWFMSSIIIPNITLPCVTLSGKARELTRAHGGTAVLQIASESCSTKMTGTRQ